MAMNPMQKKARTSFLLGMLLTLVITGIIIGLLIAQLSKIKKEEASIQYCDVYVLNVDVTSGDNIATITSEGKVKPKATIESVRAEHSPNNAITKDNISTYINDKSTAKISVRKGTVLTTDMINVEGVEATADVRLQEYNMIILPSQLEEGETVDIRLRLPSGEDYIVLSKKHIEQTNSDTIWIKVAEQEILTMSNAIVEAYIMQGSLLYATPYMDAGMQKASGITYVPKQEVINLINADHNITATAMNALKEGYTERIREQRANINKAIDGYSENALTNIETKQGEEIEKRQAARKQYVEGLAY